MFLAKVSIADKVTAQKVDGEEATSVRTETTKSGSFAPLSGNRKSASTSTLSK